MFPLLTLYFYLCKQHRLPSSSLLKSKYLPRMRIIKLFLSPKHLPQRYTLPPRIAPYYNRGSPRSTSKMITSPSNKVIIPGFLNTDTDIVEVTVIICGGGLSCRVFRGTASVVHSDPPPQFLMIKNVPRCCQKSSGWDKTTPH